MPALLDAVPGLTVLHQCGARNLESTETAYLASGADPARWEVCPFFDDMPARFAAAHLVLSRSGASTVAELAAAGKPALLVPFAAAADEHQRRNAEAMVAAGAAVMLQERELDEPGRLLREFMACSWIRIGWLPCPPRHGHRPIPAPPSASPTASLAPGAIAALTPDSHRHPKLSKQKARLPKQTGLSD